MAGFRRAGTERVNAFAVGGAYLFKHYFEEEVLFARLQQYYDDHEYRFEVPDGRFEGVRALLDDHGYGLVVVDDPEPFAVVKRKYTEHPGELFKRSVLHRSLGGFNCFVMKDSESFDRAVAAGATPLAETDLSLSI